MARVYVGNLPMNVREKDVEDLFYKYGRIRDIDLKTPARPPSFAFVAFEDVRDAEDAVSGRDGYEMDGQRLRVELARGARERGFGGGGGGFDERGGGRGFGAGRGGGRGGPPMGGGRQTEWRVIVTGLPPSASWQDLKDHMRKAGDVVYTDVDHRGGGIVHYATRSDMDYALRKLDDSEFRNPFDKSYIRVLPHRANARGGGAGGSGGGGGRDSRSRSPARRAARRRYSSSRSRSGSKSRSRSPAPRKGGRSRSRSRSPRSERSRSASPAPRRRRDSEDAEGGGSGAAAAAPMEEEGAAADGAAAAAAEGEERSEEAAAAAANGGGSANGDDDAGRADDNEE